MTDPSFKNPCLGRLVAGAQPRGSIHLGELTGAVESWVRLQDHYECIFIIADLEAQTRSGNLQYIDKRNIYEMLSDWLAAGISPNYSIIALESTIPELLKLAEILKNFSDSSLWQAEGSIDQPGDAIKAIEMLLFKADIVPLVDGQSENSLIAAQHLGSIFNQKYGDLFPLLKPHFLHCGHLPGVDGRSMQRSLGNFILMKEFDEETGQKLNAAPIDTLLIYATRFDQDQSRANAMVKNYHLGQLNEADLRQHVKALLNDYLHSMRVKRDKWFANPDELESVLQVGTRRARFIALETIEEVKAALYKSSTRS
jgi:tryptophanyl-tRNA synthetase